MRNLDVDTEDNEDLKQGTFMLNNTKKLIIKNRSNLKLITETSSPHLGYLSDVEGMANGEPIPNSDLSSNSSTNFANITDNSKLKLDSNYLQYVIWLLLSFFLVLLTFHTFNEPNQSIFIQIILGSIIVFILYQLVSYIRNK